MINHVYHPLLGLTLKFIDRPFNLFVRCIKQVEYYSSARKSSVEGGDTRESGLLQEPIASYLVRSLPDYLILYTKCDVTKVFLIEYNFTIIQKKKEK